MAEDRDDSQEKTIFTFRGILLDPRNGLEIKKAESLIEHKKNANRYSIKSFSSKPGSASIGWKNGRGIVIT